MMLQGPAVFFREKEALALGVGSLDVREVALRRMERTQPRGLVASTVLWHGNVMNQCGLDVSPQSMREDLGCCNLDATQHPPAADEKCIDGPVRVHGAMIGFGLVVRLHR